MGDWVEHRFKDAKHAENYLVCFFLTHFSSSLQSPFSVSLPPRSLLFSFRLSCLCALFGEKCQINRNVTSRIRSLLLYLLIEVPSYLSVWQLLLTSDVFFESESAFFGSECYRQQRSVRVKLNAGLYTELLLPPAITKLVIHLIVNPAFFFQRKHSPHRSFSPLKISNKSTGHTVHKPRLFNHCLRTQINNFIVPMD